MLRELGRLLGNEDQRGRVDAEALSGRWRTVVEDMALRIARKGTVLAMEAVGTHKAKVVSNVAEASRGLFRQPLGRRQGRCEGADSTYMCTWVTIDKFRAMNPGWNSVLHKFLYTVITLTKVWRTAGSHVVSVA